MEEHRKKHKRSYINHSRKNELIIINDYMFTGFLIWLFVLYQGMERKKKYLKFVQSLLSCIFLGLIAREKIKKKKIITFSENKNNCCVWVSHIMLDCLINYLLIISMYSLSFMARCLLAFKLTSSTLSNSYKIISRRSTCVLMLLQSSKVQGCLDLPPIMKLIMYLIKECWV